MTATAAPAAAPASQGLALANRVRGANVQAMPASDAQAGGRKLQSGAGLRPDSFGPAKAPSIFPCETHRRCDVLKLRARERIFVCSTAVEKAPTALSSRKGSSGNQSQTNRKGFWISDSFPPMSHQAPTRSSLIAAFTAIYLIWGSTYLAMRFAVETIPPFLMASARFLVAGSILSAFIAMTRGFRATPRQWFDNAITGGLLLLGGNGLVSWAEQKIPSGITTLVISIGPLFIVLLDWLVLVVGRDPERGTRPNAPTFLGLTMGFAGLGLLVGPDLASGNAKLDPWRLGGLIVACFSWGVGSLHTRYVRKPAEPFTAAAIQQLTGCVWLLLVSLLLREPWHFHPSAVSAKSLLAWGYLIMAGSLVGFTTFIWLMKNTTPARAATYAYVNPVVAVFLGWLIADEPVSGRTFGAAAIIIAGVAIITTSKNKKELITPPRQAVVAEPTQSAKRNPS